MMVSPFFRGIDIPGKSAVASSKHINHQRLKRQNGVVIVIALIVLVAMTLAGIALVRSVETGNIVAGNLAFKQGATLAGDAGSEAAITWLKTVVGTADTYRDIPALGYYATSQGNVNLTGNRYDPTQPLIDWDFNDCNGRTGGSTPCYRPHVAISSGASNSVAYVIHRLCSSQGDPNSGGNSCISYQPESDTSPKRGELKYGDDKRFTPPPVEYYRITARVQGPRNTISFVETIIHF